MMILGKIVSPPKRVVHIVDTPLGKVTYDYVISSLNGFDYSSQFAAKYLGQLKPQVTIALGHFKTSICIAVRGQLASNSEDVDK